jgi:hypothetical protein
MTTSSGPTGSSQFDPSSGVVGAAIGALPPEIQSLLQPGGGKTSDRIQRAIIWASRRDPSVVRRHQARDPKIQQFEDIANVPLHQMDAVAQEIARAYRRRALLTGAATGLPGGLWALVAAGADVQLTAVYAVRMAAQVAQAYGYDTSILEEQAHLAEVLAIMAGVDTLRGVGNYLTREGLVHLVPEVLPKLLARLSVEITEDQAAKWAGRIIPGVGAVVGGTIDYSFLRISGHRAIEYYHNRYVAEHSLAAPGTSTAALPAGAGRVVEGTLAAPAIVGASGTQTQPAQAQTSPGAPEAPTLARTAPIPRPLAAPPAPLARKHRRSPERVALYISIFAFFFFVVTVIAIIALIFLVVQGAGHLLPH